MANGNYVSASIPVPDWKILKGKPYITVSAKGISNGLSNIINDGADFGPDTPGTITSGIQEAINYLVSLGYGGKMELMAGTFIVNQATPTYVLGNFASSVFTIPDTFAGTIEIVGQGTSNSDVVGSNATEIDCSGMPAFGTTGEAAVFSTPSGALPNGVFRIRDLAIFTPTNVGGILFITINTFAAENIYIQHTHGSNYPTNPNTYGIRSNGWLNNSSWINQVVVSGFIYGYVIDHSFFNAGILFAINCGSAVFLISGVNTNSVGGYIAFLSCAACTYGVETSITGGTLNGPHLVISKYSMYIQSGHLPPQYTYDFYNTSSPSYFPYIHVIDANVISSLGTSYAWQFPTYNDATGLIIDKVEGAQAPLIQGFSVTTPAFPSSGTAVKNTNPFPVRIYLLTLGGATAVSITDPSGTSKSLAAPAAGNEYTLDPGASITFTWSSTSPTWLWYGV
ncbi:MAG: hypothetical protein QXZ36_07420 [Thermoproteota archaeon]